MAKIKFCDINLRGEALFLIEACNTVISEYQVQDMTLTLRQLYYQLVTQNIIPNQEKSYKKLSSVLSKGRLAGLVDWDAIEDRGRMPKKHIEFDDLKQLIDAMAYNYRLDRWKGQKYYVELWVEKDALAGVLKPLADQYHITLMVNKGYSSQTAMYESSKRFRESNKFHPEVPGGKKTAILLYLGDFDPSGEDMVRDIDSRLSMFGAAVLVKKIALTPAQIRKYNPPPNPAKTTDPRSDKFIAEHGSSSYEVDALKPTVLQALIKKEIENYLDSVEMGKVMGQEKADLKKLNDLVKERE